MDNVSGRESPSQACSQRAPEHLQKLAESHSGSSKGGYLSSHPSTDERMRHLRLLAASFKDK
jgi:predicted Zn-dependent protease